MRKPGEPLPVETLPRDELEKLQNKRLRYTLREAYEHTLFWHEKFDSLGIKPEDIKNKEDLLKAYKKGLKITKEDLIKKYNELLPTYLERMYYEELWTSGFGGFPKRIPYTLDSYKFIGDGYLMCFNAIGVTPGDSMLVLLAPFPYASGIHIRENLKTLGTHLLEITVRLEPQQLLPIFRFFTPNHFWSLPTTLFNIGSEFIKMNVDPSSFHLKSIGSGSEFVTPERKEQIKRMWNAPYFDEYASTECGIIGYQCEKEFLHIPENRILFSVVNEEEKEEVSVNEEGNDLITCLYELGEKPGIFLINYSHHDLVKLVEADFCECGRKFSTISYPYREDEVVNVGGVKLYARDIEKVDGVRDYVTVLTEDEKSKKKKLEIRVVMDKYYPESELASKILDTLFASNPPAASFLYNVGDIKIVETKPENLYEGLKILPGKPKRLIRI